MTSGVIDSHQHFWQVGRFDYPWLSPDLGVLYRDYLPGSLEPVLERNCVARTVLVQASNSLAETRWLLSLADRFDFVAGVVGWVDLTSPGAGSQAKEFAKHPKFCGVRHLVESEADDDWLVQPGVLEGLRTLGECGLSYDLLVHTRHLSHVKTVARACPGLSLVVDHMAKPPVRSGELEPWARALREVAEFSNVWCKLSGLVTEADLAVWKPEDLKPFVEVAIECFGPNRMMFGSDYPVCLRAAEYDRVLSTLHLLLADLNEADRSAVFRENAAAFYRLPPAATN
jgi:L-fuconolactonase